MLRSINITLSASLENQASFSGPGEHIHQQLYTFKNKLLYIEF